MASDVDFKKTDRRVLRTRKAIMNAFDKLMSSDDACKVTVSAIAREAHIDRKTFYLHFKSIDDLADYRIARAVEHILETLRAEGDGKTFPERLHLVLTDVNSIVTTNLGVYANAAARLSSDDVLKHFERIAGPVLERAGLNPEMTTNRQRQMRLQFFVAGALSLYLSWLRSDRSQPIEEVSAAIEGSIGSLYGQGNVAGNRFDS